MTEKQDSTGNFVPFDGSDVRYAGAKAIIDREREHIAKRSGSNPDEQLTGLAISGGGIRSASFALGVLQALAWGGKLGRFDYLSTVSGGGYIGSSLTWLLHRFWPKREAGSKGTSDMAPQCDGESPKNLHFGVDEPCFPYGAKERTAEPDHGVRVKNAILRHLRQNASYLDPGNGISAFSLMAVILRGMLVSLAVYLPMLVAIQFLLIKGGLLKVSAGCTLNGAALLALTITGIFVVWALLYALGTHFSHTGKVSWYEWRRRYEVWAGRAIVAVIVLLVAAVIPWVAHTGLAKAFAWLMAEPPEHPARYATIATTVLGALFGGGAYRGRQQPDSKLPVGLLAVAGAALLVFGLALGAYLIANRYVEQPAYIWGALGAGLLLGWMANINFISIHRYYRDRLMETFMPGVPDAYSPGSGPSPAADGSWLRRMCAYPGTPEAKEEIQATGPYHIVNTNLILVKSKVKKFKGRGGDNFILTPLYCGSNATGWLPTGRFMDGRMTLSTAVAISGAAANPNAAPGGGGPTRGPLLSFLMALLNLRLGYWVPNPNPDHNPKSSQPNFVSPGLGELFRWSLDETNPYVNLSDGGHFENLAMYELIRRRVKLIVCTDAGADAGYTFGDFANFVEKVRVDFGVRISARGEDVEGVDLRPLVPGRGKDDAKGNPAAERGYVLADIHYPDEAGVGTLLYLKSTWLGDLPTDLLGYKYDNPTFPDQTTADQFFDERQFEAYRELGYQIGCKALEDGGLPGWF